MNGGNQKIIIYGSSLFGTTDKEFIVRVGATSHSEYCRKIRRKLREAHNR
jgi:hypothetical protein